MANKVNLFNGPAVKPVKKKAEKRTIEITDAALFNKVVDLVDKNEQIDALSGQAKMLASELKECTIAEFSKAYAADGECPESFILRVKNGKGESGSVMVVPTDKYITIDEDRFIELRKMYGNSIVEERKTFTINEEMIDKYGQVLSDFIMSSKLIADEDRLKIISGEVKFVVKKGSIDKAKEFLKKKFNADGVLNFIQQIRPIFQNKNVKLDQ